MKKHYSQYLEEPYVLSYFAKRKGAFLDIGSNDGITFSNTHALSQLGWAGYLFECDPVNVKLLKANCERNKKLKVFPVALTAAFDGDILFFTTTEDKVHNTHNGSRLLSTTSPEQVVIWQSEKVQFDETTVHAISVNTFRKLYPDITFNFINIDVEGENLSLLMAMDLADLGAELVCVEHQNRQGEVVAYCEQFGLTKIVYQNGVNIIMGK